MEILKYVWQLPQNLLALLLLAWYKILGDLERNREYAPEKICLYFSRFMPSGISLGKYIILSGKYLKGYFGRTLDHERGHCRQSVMLGPLYLIIIGLPSLCGNIFSRVAHKKWPYQKRVDWYYNQPWEKWADKLGGVVR